MAIFIGQFLVTAGLLNRVAAPLIRERFRFIKELTFRITGNHITARIAGRRSFLRFKGFAAARLVEFTFDPPLYRAGLRLNLEMQPRFLEPLFVNLLKNELDRLPGMDWSGDRLQLEFAEMPFFTQIIEERPWNSILSRIEIAPGEHGAKGELSFNIYLHDCRGGDNGSGAGENKTSGKW